MTQKCWLRNYAVKNISSISLDKYKIGLVRNPYERLVTEYKDSWNYCGFEQWIRESDIQPQSVVLQDCDAVVSVESWETDFAALGLTPDKDILDKLMLKYSTDYRRWYGTACLDAASSIVQSDLDTYGYRF